MSEENKKKITLKVKEGISKDVGRAIARIDPADIKYLDLEVGEIVNIKGKRETPARIMPCYSKYRNNKIIQIDGITRENCQAGLGEKVSVKRANYNKARNIELSPLTVLGARGRSKDSQYLGSIISGIPVSKGDKVRAILFGSQSSDFKVQSTVPNGVVLIEPETRLDVKTEKDISLERAKTTYEDIGGLKKQIQRIREMIELPLRYPEIYERLGIDPPKGVLLHGPPGTGKTLIARAVANETDAFFTSISGPEIMGKLYGESEGRLRDIFKKAKSNPPSILFIDEIEAIAPKREEMGGEKQVERRVVAQLLALLDGLESRGELIVIGATNIPNVIDPALRRPGRFDREISIPIPDKNGRLEILQIHTRGMPIGEEVSLNKLAEITHGFVGADIEALAREAAMASLRKILPKIDFEMDNISYNTLQKLEVNSADFMTAMTEVEPSAIREVFVEIPEVSWEDVGGLDNIKKELIESIEWPISYPDIFSEANVAPPKGILLYGKPGTGKTLLAKAVASKCDANFISVKGPALMSKYIGETERSIREVFKKAKQAAPAILFFDEIESLVPKRRAAGADTRATDRVTSQFLTEMDGIEELREVLVLAATNRIDLIDPALTRRGRFDLLLELPVPDEETRENIFKIHTKNKPLDNDVDLEELARKTDSMVGSDIDFVCRKAGLLAIRDFFNKHREKRMFKISKKHFNRALKLLEEQKAL